MSRIGQFKPFPPPAGGTAIQDVHDTATDRISDMRREVEGAVLDGRLTIAFQPVAGIGPIPDIAFHEVLLRMVEPDGALVPARNFLPLFGEPELGRVLDRTALKRALQALKADLRLRVSVNVGAKSFGCEEWLALLDEAERVVPDICRRLLVEFPQKDALADPDKAHAFMTRLAGKGVGLALDQVTADAIWQNALADFRFDLIKIDGRFFSDAGPDTDLAAATRSLVDTARSFEMKTVAEFVETPQSVLAARGLGIDCVQGYLIGQPELGWKQELKISPDIA